MRVEIKKSEFFIPKTIIIRHEYGMVVMFVNEKRIELTTMLAHSIGMKIALTKLEPHEMMVLNINGEIVEINKLVSTALLRKADDADDFQRRKI